MCRRDLALLLSYIALCLLLTSIKIQVRARGVSFVVPRTNYPHSAPLAGFPKDSQLYPEGTLPAKPYVLLALGEGLGLLMEHSRRTAVIFKLRRGRCTDMDVIGH